MTSYLILRLISFVVVIAIAMFSSMALWYLMMLLAIVHYILAVPYSKRLIADSLSRPSTCFYFSILMTAALVISCLPIESLLYTAFGFHYVLSEVYLMHETILPDRWKDSRALRVASLLFNLSVYFASIKAHVLFWSAEQVTLISYSSCAVCACVIPFFLYKYRTFLTKQQIAHVCAFELLGLALVLITMNHPVPPTIFILYHVFFWFFYPTYKMFQHGQVSKMCHYIGANIALTALVLLVMPFSPLPLKMSNEVSSVVFRIGSLFHIIASLGVTTAQPAWITNIFHPRFSRVAASQSVSPGVERVIEKTRDHSGICA